MKKTPSTKQKTIQRRWHLFDVKGKTLGRIAPGIAQMLRGKAKSYFVPHLDCGDYVVVVNASQVHLTGKKPKQKTYTRYSGYPGGLKTETFEALLKRKPEDVVRHAVSGMLPKNRLHDQWLSRLHIFAGQDHPHGDKVAK